MKTLRIPRNDIIEVHFNELYRYLRKRDEIILYSRYDKIVCSQKHVQMFTSRFRAFSHIHDVTIASLQTADCHEAGVLDAVHFLKWINERRKRASDGDVLPCTASAPRKELFLVAEGAPIAKIMDTLRSMPPTDFNNSRW